MNLCKLKLLLSSLISYLNDLKKKSPHNTERFVNLADCAVVKVPLFTLTAGVCVPRGSSDQPGSQLRQHCLLQDG